MRKKIDNIILICAGILGIWSVVMVISTTFNTTYYSGLYLKQILALILGFSLLMILSKFSYKIMEELSSVIYLIAVLLLVSVFLFGVEVHGGRRWINLGLFYFQPVEFAKIAVILLLAHIMEKQINLFFGILAVVIVMVMVMAQPDAGSALLFIPVFVCMLAVSHYNTRWMVVVIPFIGLAAGILLLESYLNVNSQTLLNFRFLTVPFCLSGVIYFIFKEIKKIKKYINSKYLLGIIILLWASLGTGILVSKILRNYQKKRIISFLLPELDPLGTGYNIRQSLLAVGSGRFFGKGLFRGTQTQLGFLPGKHTDFVFAAVSEELGLLGALVMIFIMGVLLWQNINIMERAEDYGGRLIACGIFALFFTQGLLNLGVVMGLLPVIGIQLPLVSYGGTGMVMFMAQLGILLSINRRTDLIGEVIKPVFFA